MDKSAADVTMASSPAPYIIANYPCDYLLKLWNKGLFKEYSDNHFLMLAMHNKLNRFRWTEQFINNNLSIYPVVNRDKTINFDLFCCNFCMNLSNKLFFMSKVFGEDKIESFILDQLSAGKDNYDENAFFQALSEIEVLCFFHRGYGWDKCSYEPRKTKYGKNPEASFSGEVNGVDYTINVEVKTAGFPAIKEERRKVVIPAILQDDKCEAVEEYCRSRDISVIKPRVAKLVDFINSACSKFSDFSSNVINLLYINWSYGDFPSNAYLEPWSILTNPINGILNHKGICDKLGLRKALSDDFDKKITAIIVYTSSIEQLMFTDFRHVWQRNGEGCKFRMWLLDENLSGAILNITGMNPHDPGTHRLLIDYMAKGDDEKAEACKVGDDLLRIIDSHALK